MFEDLHFVSVVSAESIKGSEPHEPLLVLQDRCDADIGQALLNRDMIEFQISCLRVGIMEERAEEKERQ